MKRQILISCIVKWLTALCLLTIVTGIQAQVTGNVAKTDTLITGNGEAILTDDMPLNDIIGTTAEDGTIILNDIAPDSIFQNKKQKRDWSTWRSRHL